MAQFNFGTMIPSSFKSAWNGFFNTREKRPLASQRNGDYDGYGYYHYNETIVIGYDGEKDPGAMGTIKKYKPDYRSLRNRSWQAYMDSDVAQAVIKKYIKWIIGKGLKLQSEPVVDFLSDNGIRLPDEYSKRVERSFSLFCNSKSASYDKQQTLHKKAKEAYKNAIVGGDTLVILRIVDMKINVQCIDGDHIVSPFANTPEFKQAEERGNTIEYGVEMDKSGEHIAYYVYDRQREFKRVTAREEDGILRAYMVYGMKYRYDGVRGIPLISAVLQTTAQLDRYKEAMVGSAEERAKIPYTIEHGESSTGINPLTQQVKENRRLNRTIESGNATPYERSEKIASNIAGTSKKQVYNMPPDSKLKAIETTAELHFKDFFGANVEMFCATIDIPVDVALSKYNSSYSASRAAIQDWGHTILVERDDFSMQFYQPIFEAWLLMEDASQRINSPGLFRAFKNDTILFEAYTKSRFIGANVPHIDPVKEVTAIRAQLGAMGANIPLITPEEATERLGTGDFENVVDRFNEQVKMIPEEIRFPVNQMPDPEESRSDDDEED